MPKTESPHQDLKLPDFAKSLRFLGLSSVLLFFVWQIFGGVVRWQLDLVGLTVLAYAPNVLMWLSVGLLLLLALTGRTFGPGILLMMCIIALALLNGVYNTGSLKQSFFGLWVLIPVIFGVSYGRLLLKESQDLLLATFFLASAGGVIVNSVMSFPWIGVSYTLGGVELEGSREWYTSGGVTRLSGFARSSFDIAGQLIVLAGLLSVSLRYFILRAMLWGLCFAAVSLSTSKGIILTLLVCYVVSEIILSRSIFTPALLRIVFLVGLFWLFLPPFLGWSFDWSKITRTDIDNIFYGSFLDRMNGMWPEALELATTHGMPLLGRGIGGIGTPLSMFEQDKANAGDNLFVYALVMFGIFCVPVFIAAFVGIFRLCSRDHLENPTVRRAIILSAISIWYGGVSNIAENAILGLALGCAASVISLAFKTPTPIPNVNVDR